MRRIVAAGVLLLGACAAAPQTYRDIDRISTDYQRRAAVAPSTREEATARDFCAAAAYASLLGAPISEANTPSSARVIAPDSMVTEDFRPTRLNIHVDAAGTITGFGCY